jgi:hypothetical protein
VPARIRPAGDARSGLDHRGTSIQLTHLPAFERFVHTVTEAVDLAGRGEVDRGYCCLKEALHRSRSAGPSAEGLHRQYSLALVRYANRYGIPPL